MIIGEDDIASKALKNESCRRYNTDDININHAGCVNMPEGSFTSEWIDSVIAQGSKNKQSNN